MYNDNRCYVYNKAFARFMKLTDVKNMIYQKTM